MIKESMRTLASRAVVGSGLSRLGRQLRPKRGCLILYGHRVSNDDEGYMQGLRPEWLDQQLSYLGRHYEIISLDALLRCYETRQPVPEKSVVLTFDDGFRDNLDNAFPILRKHGAPATIFVVTGSLSDGHLPWSQRLGYLFQNTARAEVHHSLTGGDPLPLDTPSQRKTAYQRCKPVLSAMLWQQRDQVIAELGSLLDVDPPRDRMLTWAQARTLQAQGIAIGAHTWSHALLANIPPADASWEMRKSRDDLREHLGIEQPSFCFPAGSTNPSLQRHVAEVGMVSAFLPGQGIRINNLQATDQWTLARLGMPNAPAYQLEAEIDGPMNFLRRCYRDFRRTSGEPQSAEK